MDKKRQKAIRDFIRSVYLMPECIHSYDQMLEIRALAEGRKIKSGAFRDAAEKEMQDDDFIDRLNAKLTSLTTEDLESLSDFYKSKVMQKLRKEKDVIFFGVNLQDAIYKKLVDVSI
jgi:hypothetical protein